MGHLRTETVTLRGETYHVRELTYGDYQEAVNGREVNTLKAVAAAVQEFEGVEIEKIAEQPLQVISGLFSVVMRLSSADDPEGNSEGTPAGDSSSG